MEPDAGKPGGFGLQAQTTGGLIGKIILLAVVTAIAVWLAIPLIATEMWVLLAIVIVTTVALYVIYLQPVHIPVKYLVPGTIFLIVFQVVPVIFTATTAFTNFGDGHRGTKEEAIAAVERGSVQQVEGSTEYVLTIAAEGNAATRRPRVPARRPRDDDRPAGRCRGSDAAARRGAQRAGQGHGGPGGPGPPQRR